jgi:hypothetical protein
LRTILDDAVMKKLIPANPARNPGYRLKAKSRKTANRFEQVLNRPEIENQRYAYEKMEPPAGLEPATC